MSLELHTVFSENDSATFRDYSTKGNDGTTTGSPTLEVGTNGYRVAWDGADYSLHGDISAVEGIKNFTLMWRGYIAASSAVETIAGKDGVWRLGQTTSNQIRVELEQSAKTITLTSTSTYDSATELVVMARYDGTNSALWINGVAEDTDAAGADTALDTSTEQVVQGAGYTLAGGATNYFTGKTEEFRLYTDYLNLNNAIALRANNKGTYLIMSSLFDPGFNAGDLIYNNTSAVGEVNYVVTVSEGSGVYKVNPVNSSAPIIDGMHLKRVGHCWDTARQQMGRIGEASLFPYFEILHGVSSFTHLTDGTKVVTTIGEKGIGKREVTKTANYTLTDNDVKCFADATSGAITITLPAFPYLRKEYEVIKIDSSANAVTISGNGNNVNGLASQSLISQYDSVRLSYHDSAGAWYVV